MPNTRRPRGNLTSPASAHAPSPTSTAPTWSTTGDYRSAALAVERMPNQPRSDNPHRSIRVEEGLWLAAERACAKLETTRADVVREALRQAVREAEGTDCA